MDDSNSAARTPTWWCNPLQTRPVNSPHWLLLLLLHTTLPVAPLPLCCSADTEDHTLHLPPRCRGKPQGQRNAAPLRRAAGQRWHEQVRRGTHARGATTLEGHAAGKNGAACEEQTAELCVPGRCFRAAGEDGQAVSVRTWPPPHDVLSARLSQRRDVLVQESIPAGKVPAGRQRPAAAAAGRPAAKRLPPLRGGTGAAAAGGAGVLRGGHVLLSGAVHVVCVLMIRLMMMMMMITSAPPCLKMKAFNRLFSHMDLCATCRVRTTCHRPQTPHTHIATLKTPGLSRQASCQSATLPTSRARRHGPRLSATPPASPSARTSCRSWTRRRARCCARCRRPARCVFVWRRGM